MNISFDFGKDISNEQLAIIHQGNSGIVLSEMKNLIKRCFVNLEEDINWQKVNIIVIIRDRKVSLKYENADRELSKRMEKSISDRDLQHLAFQAQNLILP